MKEIKNIKVNVNMFDDTKLKIIDTKPERDLINYIWFRMMTLAGKVNRDGELYLSKNLPHTIDTLSIEFNRSAEEVGIALNVLIDLEMIGFSNENVITVLNFSKHQNIKKKSNLNDKHEEKIQKDNENIDKDKDKKEEEIDKTGRLPEEIICNDKEEKIESAKDEISLNVKEKSQKSQIKDNPSIIAEKGVVKNNLKHEELKNDGLNDNQNIESLNEYIAKKNKKSRKSNRKKKVHDDIKCVDSYDDINEEFIGVYDGEMIPLEGEIIQKWVFDN